VIPTRGRPPTTVKGWRKKLVDATTDECEAVGRCECGQRLEDHAPLPKPRPISAKSPPISDVGWRSGRRWTANQRAAHTGRVVGSV